MNNNDELKLHEYDSLRAELRENKKFIFERAAITVIGTLALIKTLEDPVIYILPTVAIGLLIYNLLFTTTRFKSSANMVATIIRFHEGDLRTEWFGWENYLFYYRAFENDEIKERVTQKMNDRFKHNLNRYLFNYHRIFAFHIYTILGFMLFSFYSIVEDIFFDLSSINPSNKMFWMKITSTLLNVLLFIYVIRKKGIRPKSVVTSIQYFYIMCEEIVSNKKQIKQIIQGQ